MSINLNCPNRIKPKLLREIKTEALLVFIRTTLEQSFHQIDTKGYNFQFGNKEDNEIVYSILRNLLNKLQDSVVNSSYLLRINSNPNKNTLLKNLQKREESLIHYYDSLVKGIEKNISKGTAWIPELVVVSLLSEWIIEEEKSAYLYPFLRDIDYLYLINIYDKIKMTLDCEKKEIVTNMYRLSSDLIIHLKNSTYKVNTHRKRKRKK